MDVALSEAYRESLAEVRAQIDRTWDTSKFFVLLNLSVVAGALTILQFGSQLGAKILASCAFVGGAGLCFAGISALREAKRYYRVCVAKKTLYEQSLGMTQAFPGQERSDVGTYATGGLATRSKLSHILKDVDGYAQPKLRATSIAGWSRTTLIAIAVFDIVAAVVTVTWR